ncbi:YhcN/YlaJ family sporulation lipoprotein [Schnuerera sp. xch1]|uniref:YhcN/YlaJ family sporulation lipoprotein n=1 Tax=Schnuerera sp. xch1 TaxID=2874283 RepID=UPI001CBB212B|nr:YhcN/YlaJ family sporulation lipoprotein [Schnuerera sp. xch1]MBZ2173725.1 YhcN/YlaJ family sporulation lipoprotein [Schnuerera sp. xch1]
MKKNKVLFFVIVIALVITAIGCTTQPGGTENRIGLDSPNNNNGLRRNNNMIGQDRTNNNNLTDMDNNMNRRDTDLGSNVERDNNAEDDMSERADEIAEEISDLNNINNASVLINNDTAIVGVDMENDAEGEVTTDLKQQIERIVKNEDDDIDNVNITADPDLFTRISNMAEDIGNGRPVSGFADQFQEILRRITPVR